MCHPDLLVQNLLFWNLSFKSSWNSLSIISVRTPSFAFLVFTSTFSFIHQLTLFFLFLLSLYLDADLIFFFLRHAIRQVCSLPFRTPNSRPAGLHVLHTEHLKNSSLTKSPCTVFLVISSFFVRVALQCVRSLCSSCFSLLICTLFWFQLISFATVRERKKILTQPLTSLHKSKTFS